MVVLEYVEPEAIQKRLLVLARLTYIIIGHNSLWIPNARESFSRLWLTSLIRRAKRRAGQATSLCFQLLAIGTNTWDIDLFVNIDQLLNCDYTIHMHLCNDEWSKTLWVKASRAWYPNENFVANCIVFEVSTVILASCVAVDEHFILFTD